MKHNQITDGHLHFQSNATAMLAAISAINKVYLSHKDTISLDVMEDMLKTYKMGFPYRK